MKRIVILTGHFPIQKRRGSVLWVSEHLQRMGWHVDHVTLGYSWLSYLRKDPRLTALGYRPKRGTQVINPHLTAHYIVPWVHPLRLLDRFRLNGFAADHFVKTCDRHLRPILRAADVVLCESGLPVLLGPRLAEHAPNVPRIYRVNDDIEVLGAPTLVVEAEKANARHFTRISTASPHLAERFDTHSLVTLDPMGVPRDRLCTPQADPYQREGGRKIAVCAGTTQLDMAAVLRTATARPNWDIHVLGRLRETPPQRENLTWHGEQSFDTTLAHVAHADIGLAPYLDAPGVAYQTTNSNRMLLYRHFGLPILGPERLCHPDVPSIISDSAPDALERCESWARVPEAMPDWSELAQRLVQNGETVPPSEVSMPPETAVKSRVNAAPALTSSA